MNVISKTPRLELLLHAHQLLTLDNAQHNMAIECKEGVIWVTASGEPRDRMLYSGQRYMPMSNGKVVIEAIDEACVDIEEQ